MKIYKKKYWSKKKFLVLKISWDILCQDGPILKKLNNFEQYMYK